MDSKGWSSSRLKELCGAAVSTASGSMDRSQLAASLCGAIAAGTLCRMLWLERYAAGSAVILGLALIAVAILTDWWRRRRLFTVTVAVNLLCVLTFLWSLDEQEHIVISEVKGQYIASVGGTILPLARVAQGQSVGLFTSTISDERVSPMGEVPWDPDGSRLSDFGAWMRLAFPPAWSNVRVSTSGAGELPSYHPQALVGSWATNRRGELVVSDASTVVLGTLPTSDWTIEANLMRGDGPQGILIESRSRGQGVLLEIREDRSDVQWVQWNEGTVGATLASSFTRPDTIAMLQRNLRLLLTNYMVGVFLLLLALPMYALLLAVFRGLAATDGDVVPFENAVPRPRRIIAVALALAAIATLSTAWISSDLLQRIPHVQDSVADLFQAKTFALGRLWVPTPRLPTFFTEEFIPMHGDKWFSKYPPGWPLLLSIGVLLHASWLVDPVLSGLDLFLIFLIGRRVYGSTVGLLAAALTLTSPFFLFLGGSFMPHTATLFYLLCALYLVTRWSTEARNARAISDARLLVPAGFLLGMAFMTRQIDAIAFSLPFGALLLARLRQKDVLPVVWLLAGGAVPVTLLLGYDWILTGSPFTSPYSLWWPSDRVGFGPTIGMGGFTPAQGLWNTSFNLEMFLAHLFGWPFYTCLALAAVPFALGRARLWDWMFLASALCVMAAYVAYWNPGVMYGPRYFFTTIPACTLLTARGLVELYQWPLRLFARWRLDRIAPAALPACIIAILLAFNFFVYLPAQVPLYRGYNYTSADSIDAVQRAGIHHALIFVVSNTPGAWWLYGSVFPSNSPLLDGDVVYARDQGSQNRLLMDEYPGRSYYLLNAESITRLSG